MPSSSREKQREYDRKRASDRRYNWNLVCYPDDLPEDWLDVLKSVTPGFCSPAHDRDFNADGERKKVHNHVTLCFSCKVSKKQLVELLKGLFGSINDSIRGVATPQPCMNVTGSVRYMTHVDNPEKAQYERESIVCWGGKSLDAVWGNDNEITRDYLIGLEQLIETRGIVELSDLSRILRDEEKWELYDTLTRRCTVYINAFLASRRHRAERVEDGQNERAAVQLMDMPGVDMTTGEVIGCSPSRARDALVEPLTGCDNEI